MAIPSFKQVNINFPTKEKIFEQLSLHQFGQLPYIFTISHLEDEVQALSFIEEYLQENDISNYPYPIYIISTLKLYKGPFTLFEKIEELPRFFKQKIKQLNTKENKILQKIYLKQQKRLAGPKTFCLFLQLLLLFSMPFLLARLLKDDLRPALL